MQNVIHNNNNNSCTIENIQYLNIDELMKLKDPSFDLSSDLPICIESGKQGRA